MTREVKQGHVVTSNLGCIDFGGHLKLSMSFIFEAAFPWLIKVLKIILFKNVFMQSKMVANSYIKNKENKQL